MAQQPLPDSIVDQLLDKLSTDDGFRDLFQRNPEAAFERLGFSPTREQLMCCKPHKLADKETIAATRDEMRRLMVLGTLWFIPNKWEADPPQS